MAKVNFPLGTANQKHFPDLVVKRPQYRITNFYAVLQKPFRWETSARVAKSQLRYELFLLLVLAKPAEQALFVRVYHASERASRSLRACLRSPEKREQITPVLEASTGD